MRSRAAIVLAVALAAGCGDASADRTRLAQARLTSADLLFQFTHATDASNRAAMADRIAAASSLAAEAEAARTAVQKDADQLRPILHELRYAPEVRMLDQFTEAFATYSTLDRTVLELAGENSNTKAQDLSFGAAQSAADALKTALDAVSPARADRDVWQSKALSAAALSAVRQVQVLQSRHIPNADDAAMTEIESRMNAEMAEARRALAALAPLANAASRAHVADASAALDRFAAVNGEIIALSRRNTNVRSRALSLDEKQNLIRPCLDAARALYDALAKRGDTAAK